MGAAHHDSAAFLEVVRLELADSNHPAGRGRGETAASDGGGWYVRRICPCHRHVVVSVSFGTRAEAERCRLALDEDCRRSAERALTKGSAA
jgi:hypothetical protein